MFTVHAQSTTTDLLRSRRPGDARMKTMDDYLGEMRQANKDLSQIVTRMQITLSKQQMGIKKDRGPFPRGPSLFVPDH